MTLYGLDPGTEESALVAVSSSGEVVGAYMANSALCDILRRDKRGDVHLVIEQIESYGMAVGREVFSTVFWSGRFAQAWEGQGYAWSLLPRRDVKLTLCGSMRAKDANIRQALLDRYGGKAATKKGGPLYGIKSHCWSALALAVTYQEQRKLEATHAAAATAAR